MANYQYAIGLASGSPDPRIRAELVYAQSFQIYNHCLGGWPLRALSMAERLLEENSPLLSASILIDVHTSAFTACYYAGQYDQAGHHLQMAHELLDKTDRERKRVLLLAVTSRAELAMGNLDACLQASDMMLAYSRANQDRLLEAEAGRARADLMLWLGYPQEALEQYRLAYQVFTLENYVRLEIGARLGYTLGLVGRLDEARALLAQIIAASERLGLGTVSLPARFYQAHLDLLFGEPDAAGDALARLAALRDEGQQRGLLRVYLMVGLALAGAYLQLGEPEAARVLHAQVRQRAAASHALLLEVYACARSGAPAAETQALLARLDAQTQRPELRPYVEGFVARLAAG